MQQIVSKRTLIVVGATVLVAASLDIITYSIGQSKGGPFRLHMPLGKALLGILALGVVEGVFVDQAIKALDNKLAPPEEASLDTIVAQEKSKIASGEIKNKQATGVIWA